MGDAEVKYTEDEIQRAADVLEWFVWEYNRGGLTALSCIRAMRRRTEEGVLHFCWSRGPRVGSEGGPICFRRDGHDGSHRSHPASGFDISWDDPAMKLSDREHDDYWKPLEYVP
ncbi:hypothetical protein SEA_LOZINAK_153 [Gordonia phage Lozinak]|uniref:Uncharacterized protein n=3 Tax=Smoothievirus TaxID=1982557 RepID=A0A2D1GFZ7_9CAUD|nr:hypothetical protein BH768_gp053 [Gordonia phage ClubL]YP_009276267.1 hypothetical protein BH772_gp055 [Gordonia phage Bachita]YP_009281306.1 hypothetical protein BIZ74_gp053 [Gordonia phage Cucurbita]ATN90779.1 hypothetical protein SEA_LOZINAK_153 [Gordonia phage Lozinak]AUE23659.1 hypothetical protein SEA_TONIANN_153 [Gordonia phage Toniann]QYC53635.1 hypothetical protein SEA_NORVS_151 [Gordonia phage Norvs]ANA86651.1 hypothetical protein PBI_CLUBL_154 [Gordonia phage ClubL]ANA86830.1 h